MHFLNASLRISAQASVVDVQRDEAADRRMHAVRAIQKDTALRRDRVIAAEQMLQNGASRMQRMRALRDLGELQRIAEQYDVSCRGGHRDGVGERNLARLVDEQVVERTGQCFARKKPRRSAGKL